MKRGSTVSPPLHVRKAIAWLRRHGHAVVTFNPEELDGCPPRYLEPSLVEYAWDAIETLKKCAHKEASSEDHRSR